MAEESRHMGETFRLRRKELNLSLKEVENATSIRINYLQLIEAGEMEKLISPVYACGFVKQYATFLGIDGEQIIKSNPQLFRSPQPQVFSYGIGTLEVRGNPSAGIKWFPNFWWIVATALIAIGAWALASFLDLI